MPLWGHYSLDLGQIRKEISRKTNFLQLQEGSSNQNHHKLVTRPQNKNNLLWPLLWNIFSQRHRKLRRGRWCHSGQVVIYVLLVWTPCLMHRCVCIWQYILQITTTNYISKTSLYITFRMYSSGPWPLKILMFALLVTREIATYSWVKFFHLVLIVV